MAEWRDGVLENTGGDLAWSANSATTAAPTFSMESLRESMNRIQAQPVRPSTILLPPPPQGMNQKARRARRVRLRNGMLIELPESIHPYEFLLSGEETRNWLLERALGCPDVPVGRLDSLELFDTEVYVSRAVPPGTVFMVPQKAFDFLEEKRGVFGRFRL